MRRSTRGLAAFAILLTTLVAGTVATVRGAGIGDDEANAAYAFRSALVQELRDVRTRLAEHDAHIRSPSWHLVQTPDAGVVAVDLRRLRDHVPLAQLLLDRREAYDAMRTTVSAWDSPSLMSAALLMDAARDGSRPEEAAAALERELVQPEDEKRALLRRDLRWLRGQRELLITAIDTFDAVLAGLGLEPASPAADEVEAAPPAEAAGGTLGALQAFRDELAADAAIVHSRLDACRTAVDEPGWIVLGQGVGLPDVLVFDLSRLPAYDAIGRFIGRNPWAWDIFNADAAALSELHAAVLQYATWPTWPDDLEQAAPGLAELNRQPRGEKRRACRPILQATRAERDSLDRAIALLDELITVNTPAEPAPSEPPAQPTAEPTPAEPTPSEPPPTPAPNPFADV